MAASEDTPVGLAEIADRLGVKRQTVDNWQQRNVLPEPRWTVGRRPAWSWQRDIEPWARETGRLDTTRDRAPKRALTPEQEEAVKRRRRSGEALRTIAADYDVSLSLVSRIARTP